MSQNPAAGSRHKLPDTDLVHALRACRRAVVYCLIFSLVMNILLLMLPIYSLQVLDRVISSHSIETLIVLSIIAMIGFVFYGLFNAIRAFVLGGMVQWLDEKMGPDLLRVAIVRASLGHAVSAGQFQRDLQSIKGFLVGGLTALLDAPWSLIFLFIIYMINPVLGFISLCGSIVLFVLALLNEMITKKPLHEAQDSMIQSSLLADVMSRNAEAIEAMGMMPAILKNWQEQSKEGLKAQYVSYDRAQMIQSVSRVIRFVIQVGIIGFGALLTLNNEMTVGGMIACSILVARALAPYEQAIGVWKTLISARDAYRRLNAVLLTTPQLRGTMSLPAPEGRLTAEGVFFQPQGTNAIIRNVNFGLEPGESLGIIGPSAAGKSTLAKMIIGLLPATAGSIRLDGAETFKWNREDLGRYVGYMPQQVDMFPGTIRDNIARMSPDVSDEAVIEAAKFAGCHEMILRLPKGYETEFSAGSLALSPGQRQRIGLARALYNKPRFVVLDEPNGNLDGEGERALLVALQRMKEAGMNYIVVAHRPSIVGNVDKILMLRGGMVEAFGPREEVLKQYTPKAVQPAANTQQANPGQSGEWS
jgi:PrtD family type I secretion system ABC transporter